MLTESLLCILSSFMGGTNFWGGTKEDDCFLAPSFDDRILEVVAVFDSMQMAASRLINLQHHRIAQCHSIKITLLGEEPIPVQVHIKKDVF
jgi:diacylglycerol kinase (ATP)